MYFGQIFVKNGWILVRFSGEIGQIVSQILESFSQILIISTLQLFNFKRKSHFPQKEAKHRLYICFFNTVTVIHFRRTYMLNSVGFDIPKYGASLHI